MTNRIRVFGALLFAAAAPAWSQTSTAGTVVGQVLDEQHAAVPGAAVRLVDTSTNVAQATVTNNEGRYAFTPVNPGNYNLSFTKDGFTSFQVNNQRVNIGQTLTIDATLKVGSTATTVEVTAAAGAELQTMNATVGGTLSGLSLLTLPNLGRDVTSMAVLQPATTPTGQTAGTTGDLNTYQLDGANVTDDMGGNVITYETNYSGLGGSQGGGIPSGAIPTPIESIEELKVSVSNQTSDFSNSSGGQIQMATKRGSNQFHGSAYMFYFDTAVGAANSWSNNHTPYTFGSLSLPYTPIISNHRDRFGGAIGGPLLPKAFLGGKWYFFFNYEGLRFPNTLNFSAAVPSALMRAGVIQVANSAGAYVPYNLNPNAVTVNGVTYQPAACPAGACDPRGIGINPIISQMWSKQVPLPNSPSAAGDQYNTQGFLASIREPQTSNSYVARIDHDFGDKWHWYATYRDYKLVSLTGNQIDIGGALAGDTFGTPTATAPRPQQPSVWTTGMTTTINASTTNTFVFSYLRNFWQWSDASGQPQLPGLGGALNLGGESTATTPGLIPYTVNSQAIRQRFWDGQDKQIRDDLTMLKGNHLFGFGGAYQRNFDYHSRSDNGAGVNNSITYEVANAGFNWSSPSIQYIPTGVPSSGYSNYESLYAEVTGMLSATQLMYTRKGPQLNLQPVGSNATDKDVIPYYSVYFYDTWHMKPSFTLTYGLGWNLEMPPYELNGSQVELVDSNGQAISAKDFIAQRQAFALAGSSYTPTIGYSLVGNIGSGQKYPYNPYYAEFSPKVSFAWNPHYNDGILGKLFGSGKTVVRGGYGRIFGRLNGVNLVLVPLLGPGLLQGVVCQNPLSNGTCAGNGVATPATAFRIGNDGLTAPLPAASPTLSQPFYPSVGGNPETIDPYGLDPTNLKPDRTDNFTLTVQRELNSHLQLEVGYIGKILRNEFMEFNLDSVPYMTTLGGQAFSQAYAQLYQQMFFSGASPTVVTAQPFFEAALGGSGSAFCKGYASCTQAVAVNYGSIIKATGVTDLWNKMGALSSWTLGRTMLSQPVAGGTTGQVTAAGLVGSYGYGNYNALFVTLRSNNWHGLTAISNFTWGRALGTATNVQATSSTTPLTPFDPGANYGPQGYDYKFLYNLSISYTEPYFKAQHGVLGHILGGWTVSPLFTAAGGAPISIGYNDNAGGTYEAFGEVGTPGISLFSSNAQHAVGFMPYTGGTTAHYNVDPTGVNGSNIVYGNTAVGEKVNGSYGAPLGLNMFTNPGTVFSEFRPCVLGYDSSCGGGANMRGLPTWNLDANVIKDIGVYKERIGMMLFFTFTNVLNHFQPSNPSFSLTSPTTFGQITGQANTPRNMEFGLRVRF
jgi:Carboxypeptidase regulatory-like domain